MRGCSDTRIARICKVYARLAFRDQAAAEKMRRGGGGGEGEGVGGIC
jgi:hypothetical protein